MAWPVAVVVMTSKTRRASYAEEEYVSHHRYFFCRRPASSFSFFPYDYARTHNNRRPQEAEDLLRLAADDRTTAAPGTRTSGSRRGNRPDLQAWFDVENIAPHCTENRNTAAAPPGALLVAFIGRSLDRENFHEESYLRIAQVDASFYPHLPHSLLHAQRQRFDRVNAWQALSFAL